MQLLSTYYQVMASNHPESKVYDHVNAQSQIIPSEYHTEWTQGVDPSRYWKEQEPEQ